MPEPAAQITESAPVTEEKPDFSQFHKQETDKALGIEPPKQESAPEKEPEPVVEASETAPAVETAPDPEPGSEGKTPARSDAESGVKRLLRKNYELSQEITRLKTQVQQPPAKLEAPKMPTLDESTSIEDFQSKMEKYRTDTEGYLQSLTQQAIAAREKELQERFIKDRVDEQNRIAEEGWKVRKEGALKRHPDFEKVIHNEELGKAVVASPAMDGFLLDSEHGAEMLYHLGMNVPEAKRISALPPFQVLRELFKLEEKIASDLTPKRVTSASAPVRELSGSRSIPEDQRAAAVSQHDFRTFHELETAEAVRKRA